MDSKFGYGALISIFIAVFTIISTIYPIFVTSDKTTNNINREIVKLRDKLNLNFSLDNYDDFHDILSVINSELDIIKQIHYNDKHFVGYFDNKYCLNDVVSRIAKNMSIFKSILAYREGRILINDSDSINDLDSMQYHLQCYINKVEHEDILWYPIRQLKLENESNQVRSFHKFNDSEQFVSLIGFSKLIEMISPKNSTNLMEVINQNNESESEQLFHKAKVEDFFCNELKNSIVNDEKYIINNNNHQKSNHQVTSLCSHNEIKKIINYSYTYPYVINIMNDNSDNDLLTLTQNFRLLLDYFQWFILFSFLAGPLVFVLWIRNYNIK